MIIILLGSAYNATAQSCQFEKTTYGLNIRTWQLRVRCEGNPQLLHTTQKHILKK